MTAPSAPRRVLLISGSELIPTIAGGTVRSAGIARALARLGHTVRIYAFAGRGESYGQGSTHRITPIAERLTQEVNLRLLYGLIQALARRLGIPRAWQFWLMRLGWVPKTLKEAVDWAEVVIADMPHTARLPGAAGRKPWILMSHNLEWKVLLASSAREKLWAHWMKGVEAAAPQRFDDIIAVTDEDRDFFRAHAAGKALALPIIGSAVDQTAYQVPAGVREATRAQLGVAADECLVVFSGSRFAPNLEALGRLKAFCAREEAWLSAQRIRFLILGTLEPQAYQQGRLIATGRVPEIAPYFAAADAGLNPVLTGSGANVKLFEYLAARLPVLSTSFGVRGSGLQAPLDYLPCEAEDFRPALEALRARPRAEWAAHGEAVWQRHRAICDITELTRAATAVLPGF